MSDVTQHEPQAVALTTPSTIVSAAQEMTSAGQLANGLCGTSFVPQHFRGKPEEAAAAIMYGSTLGMDPLTSLQQIYSIGGKPALYSRAMVAIVLSKGHQIWTVEDTPESVTVAGRRRGSDRVEQITWTIDRAKSAGYTSNKNYQKDPHAMLYARAAGDVARRIAPDALLGLAYSAEELELHGDTSVSTQRVKASASDFDQPEETDPAVPSDAQVKRMWAGIRSRIDETQHRAFIEETIGHPIESSKQLTRDEVAKIIDRLERM
ncbi:hypothetical protein DHOM_02760 [Dermabacter hominis 1368]|uniref:RecT-like ssDNA binding protein n=2 Tax=Dermabacter TaxID=36739 RepID=A0ABR4SN96_9MICO|nr:hypothetical protein DHOM_02760 [Dermabacter hominis 1368]